MNGATKKLEWEKEFLPFEVISFLPNGPNDYEEIWEIQKKVVEEVSSEARPDTLIICEHLPVITVGRRGKKENILQNHIPIVDIERGGDVTLHSPGQLVIYPIVKLHGRLFPKGLSEFLRFCEQTIIDAFSSEALDLGRYGPTGVWVKKPSGETKKIASIGVAVRRWTTYHGMAINVSNDLDLFRNIRPCDFSSSVMTSFQQEKTVISVAEAAEKILNSWRFNLESLRN